MHIIENPAIPFSTPIVHGMNHDAKIEIHGCPLSGAQQCFAVELFAGTNMALHMSARFGYTGDYQLVMNSLDCGVWGSETRHCNPFHIGAHFHLKIKAHRSHYKISVNGKHICDFPARISPHCVTALGIKGDVAIHKVHFEHFKHHNGGGTAIGVGNVQKPIVYGGIGTGATPAYGVGAGAAPVAAGPPPPYYAAPQPAMVQPNPYYQQPMAPQPYVQPVYMPQPVMAQPPVMIIEDGHHHHHHGLLHHLFGHHHHHRHHGHHHHHC